MTSEAAEIWLIVTADSLRVRTGPLYTHRVPLLREDWAKTF